MLTKEYNRHVDPPARYTPVYRMPRDRETRNAGQQVVGLLGQQSYGNRGDRKIESALTGCGNCGCGSSSSSSSSGGVCTGCTHTASSYTLNWLWSLGGSCTVCTCPTTPSDVSYVVTNYGMCVFSNITGGAIGTCGGVPSVYYDNAGGGTYFSVQIICGVDARWTLQNNFGATSTKTSGPTPVGSYNLTWNCVVPCNVTIVVS